MKKLHRYVGLGIAILLLVILLPLSDLDDHREFQPRLTALDRTGLGTILRHTSEPYMDYVHALNYVVCTSEMDTSTNPHHHGECQFDWWPSRNYAQSLDKLNERFPEVRDLPRFFQSKEEDRRILITAYGSYLKSDQIPKVIGTIYAAHIILLIAFGMAIRWRENTGRTLLIVAAFPFRVAIRMAAGFHSKV